jgi:cytochrome c biogenesis protein CcmG/thiol:disulfide interchange protein DsbE
MAALAMPNRLLYLAPLLVFAVVAGYFVWGLNPSRDPSGIPSVLIDQPVPRFDLPPLAEVDRPGLSSADLEDGQVTLVNVFASWCIPCRAEHKYFTGSTTRTSRPMPCAGWPNWAIPMG